MRALTVEECRRAVLREVGRYVGIGVDQLWEAGSG